MKTVAPASVCAPRPGGESRTRNTSGGGGGFEVQFPAAPPDEVARIALWTCAKFSGRVGRSAAARNWDPQAFKLRLSPTFGTRIRVMMSCSCNMATAGCRASRCGRKSSRCLPVGKLFQRLLKDHTPLSLNRSAELRFGSILKPIFNAPNRISTSDDGSWSNVHRFGGRRFPMKPGGR